MNKEALQEIIVHQDKIIGQLHEEVDMLRSTIITEADRLLQLSGTQIIQVPQMQELISSLAHVPIHIFHMDINGLVVNCNEYTAHSFSEDAGQPLKKEDLIGKDFHGVEEMLSWKEGTADVLLLNTQQAIEQSKAQIIEECVVVQGKEQRYLTYRIPHPDSKTLIGFSFNLTRYTKKERQSNLLGERALISSVLLDQSAVDALVKSLANKKISIEVNGITVYLTKRETECILHLLRYKTVKDIARILQLSPRTIEDYIARLKCKLDCNTKAELIEVALQKGFLDNFI